MGDELELEVERRLDSRMMALVRKG